MSKNNTIWITETINSECRKIIPKVCYDILKRVASDFLIQVNTNLALKKLEKYAIDKCKKIQIKKSEISTTKRFYRDPKFRERLKNISKQKQEYKKQERKENLPETNDMIILTECIVISKSETNPVGIASRDKDFTWFCDEIKRTFNIEIIPV